MQETTISLGTLGGYPSPRLKPGESRPQTPVFVEELLRQVRLLIQQGRQEVLRAVARVQVRTYWEIGRHIVEFECGFR